MVPVDPPAQVEVDSTRRYVWANQTACELLGYTREELLTMRIDDISFPSPAHVKPMYSQFVEDGEMRGIFAVRRKSGEVIWIRYKAETIEGRSRATWTHYERWDSEPSGPAPELP
jgi:PAS domain S-box-containing protein